MIRASIIASAVALAFAFPSFAERSYYDELTCAANLLARRDYSRSLGIDTAEERHALEMKARWFLELAVLGVPNNQVPCINGGYVYDHRACVVSRILEPQLRFIQIDQLVALVEATGGSGPLMECQRDPVCRNCEQSLLVDE